MNLPIKNIVIVGGGVIGWWSAIFIKRTIADVNVSILNVDIDEEYAETSQQDFSYLLNSIGLTERQIIQHADGNFRGAQGYFNWSAPNANYFHSDEIPDLAYELIDFNQWLLKLKQAGSPEKVDDYLVRSVFAKYGKLSITSGNKVGGALSFDTSMFISLLQSYANSQNINVVDHGIKSINRDANGYIESILTSKDLTLSGDFFIDASGSKARIMSGLQVGYESWGAALPCTRKRVLVSKPGSTRLIPFTSIQHTPFGWVKNIPLRSKVISEYSHANSFLSDKLIENETAYFFKDCKEFVRNPGLREKTWEKNCLALGESAVNIDSFSHSPLCLAAVTLKRFIDYWPSSYKSSVQSEFNRLMRLEFETLRDFHCLHYALAHKDNSPFGNLLKEIELPQSLQYRMTLFNACGRSIVDESTLIHPSQWVNLFLGFGCWPDNFDLMARHEAVDRYERWSKNIKNNIHSHMELAPDYTSFIQAYIASN